MRQLFNLGIVLIFCLAAGCATNSSNTSHLSGTNWQLTVLGSEWPVNPEDNLTLSFDLHSNARGSTGCNLFNAAYQANHGTIRFDNLSATERACSDRFKMDQESNYLDALSQARIYTLFDGDQRLIISGEGGQKPLEFRRGS